jgi:hypothetical protein
MGSMFKHCLETSEKTREGESKKDWRRDLWELDRFVLGNVRIK